MNKWFKRGYGALVHSFEDRKKANEVPVTPQTQAEAYRLAFCDHDF